MALDLKSYESAVKYGAKYNGSDIKAASVPGSASTLTNNYTVIAVSTTGPTAANVFGATAPVAGTITGYFVVSAFAAAGTYTLFGTTAGTIATIPGSATLGAAVGTSVVNATVAAGDSVYITGITTGTATAFITFQTAN